MDSFTFEDMGSIQREYLGNQVPLELLVCDLEGAIMEGALTRMWNKRVSVKETKCNVHGHSHCEYEIRYK
ncbi:4-vinyl reductase [Paenibacillus sp. SN-8-1]|uniref:4-vinyl reductase n=1 Tax=Paenibacillus sp. SN-8-1 TaxID=3435409 RepID=UPI003D9A32BB